LGQAGHQLAMCKGKITWLVVPPDRFQPKAKQG
jgi:hypothetical protein